MSRVKGVPRIRSLLRRLPDTTQAGIVAEFNRAGPEIATVMRGRAPFRTGATQAGISWRVQPGQMRLLVGLISTPKGRAKLFYARIQDLGRKAQVVTVTRAARGARALGAVSISGGRKVGAVSTYAMNVRAMPGKHFITGSYRVFRQRITANLKAIYARALATAAAAAGSADA
ncbi:MAG TPA: hypothetical protein VGF77_08460 [Allosphingosinicella sp.]|jgi:hypothetical protein